MKSISTVLTLLAFVLATAHCLSLEHLQQNEGDALLAAAGQENLTAEDELDWLNYLAQNRFDKRKKLDPSDPRSLFAAVYRNYPYRKRYSDTGYSYPIETTGFKRGLSSPLDPRNLFRAVYGYKK